MRWHVQSGYIAIPGSKNPDHIAENISIFDFELTGDEMKQIAALDTGHRPLRELVKIVKILVKLDKKAHFLSNTVYLLNKKAIFMGKGRFIL